MGMIGNTPYQGLIGSGNLQDGAVTTSKVADSALTAAKLAAAAVTDKLGYTPFNKAGDSITGQVTRNLSTGLGSTAGNSAVYDVLHENSGSNEEFLYLMDYRNSNGNTWTTAGSRIQKRIDSTWMGYVEFNGGNSGGVCIGAGMSTAGPGGSGINKALTVTGDGFVLHPRQPRFRIGSSGETTTYANDAVLKMASNEYDPMGCYDPSTGRFTVPPGAGGLYHFDYTVRIDNTASNYTSYMRVRPFKNGSHMEWYIGDAIYPVVFVNGVVYTHFQQSFNIELAENEYVDLRIGWGGGGATSTVLSNSGWSGYLVA